MNGFYKKIKNIMLLFAKTYENLKTIGYNFPVEDVFWCNEKYAIVADGVTRDPVGISDFSNISLNDFIKNYPRPSGGALAAEEAVKIFKKSLNLMYKYRLTKCNLAIKKLNNRLNKHPDYLGNDYFSTVAATIEINNQNLLYSYICDCGVIVYNGDGKVKFQTIDCKKTYSDMYIDEYMKSNGLNWSNPQARFYVRKYFRNNIENFKDDNCISYGCLTGENSAEFFIKSGEIAVDIGDTIIVYSDGFSSFLHDKEFIQKIINFNEKELDAFIELKSKFDYEKYGSEKTMVLFRI